ncbi:histidine--tRNA ligase [Candidatus Marsarchaeota archaeon]|nr:histidine--tRNA ligase [Candidatus Marsarchaeota archaeon]
MGEIPFPRGVRDVYHISRYARNYMLERIERVYRSFGFLPISTPCIESLEVLKAKDVIGEENKLIFELKDQNNGLRYDHTVGLARYISMHNSMPLPFKRYAIGPVWRMDEPQRLRLREFWQADVDILGGDPVQADAEAIAAGAAALDALGIDYTMRINSRQIVDALMAKLGVESEASTVMRIMDKADKIGMDGVAKELEKAGISGDVIDGIIAFVGIKGSNGEKIKQIDNMVGNSDSTSEISETIKMLGKYPIKGKIVIDTSVVRGIDYYTGIVIETTDNTGKGGTSSICSGGRYENLVSRFSDTKLPGVGLSIGIDRVLDIINFSSSEKRTYADVFVAWIKEQNYEYALKSAIGLRNLGINADINNANRNISNQLSYASSLGIPYVAIVGNSEQEKEVVKLRDMESGSEEELGLEEAAKRISQGL